MRVTYKVCRICHHKTIVFVTRHDLCFSIYLQFNFTHLSNTSGIFLIAFNFLPHISTGKIRQELRTNPRGVPSSSLKCAPVNSVFLTAWKHCGSSCSRTWWFLQSRKLSSKCPLPLRNCLGPSYPSNCVHFSNARNHRQVINMESPMDPLFTNFCFRFVLSCIPELKRNTTAPVRHCQNGLSLTRRSTYETAHIRVLSNSYREN